MSSIDSGPAKTGGCRPSVRRAALVLALAPTMRLGAATVTLDSISPSRQRVQEIITLRGQGFGAYLPGTSHVSFTGAGVRIEGGTPDVWRDDFIRLRVPAGDRIDGANRPIPTAPLEVSVVGINGSSPAVPFRVIVAPGAVLAFEQRTQIVNDRDVSGFLGAPNLNLARSKDAEVGDVNGDGRPDLVDNNSNNELNRTHGVLRLNEGEAGFSAIALEPLNPDDDGTFATTILSNGDYMGDRTTYDADLVDLTNDGLPDLVQTAARGGSPNRLRILINDHEGIPGRFLEQTAAWLGPDALPGCPDDVAHGDVDNDGWVDVAVCLRTVFGECGDPPSDVFVYLNQGGQSFADPIAVTAPPGVSSHDVFFLDANDDGFKDLVMVNENGNVSELFLNDGDTPPGFTVSRSFAFPAFAGEAADLDGDGLDDFVLVRSQSAAVFLNHPGNPGSFSSAPLPDPTTNLYDVELGDVNLDGAVDIIGAAITADRNDAVRVWINDGQGAFVNATSPGADDLLPGLGDYQRLSADLLDFDGDGDLDLYLAGADGQDVGKGDGFGRVPNQFFENVLFCPADVDGDGDIGFADLLAVLGSWGPYGGCPPFRPEDVDEDCVIGFTDLLEILADWGPCP